MALYARLLGRDESGAEVAGRLPVHQFVAILNEVARKDAGGLGMTQAQALTAINRVADPDLDAGEVTEAQALLATIIAPAGAGKLARSKEIEDVLVIASQRPGPWPGGTGSGQYDRPSDVKTRLGV